MQSSKASVSKYICRIDVVRFNGYESFGDGKARVYKITETTTISDLRKTITDVTGVSTAEFHIGFQGDWELKDRFQLLQIWKQQAPHMLTPQIRKRESFCNIYVKLVDGRTVTCHLYPKQTVGDLKCEIQCISGSPQNQHRLLYAGYHLEDGQYNFQA